MSFVRNREKANKELNSNKYKENLKFRLSVQQPYTDKIKHKSTPYTPLSYSNQAQTPLRLSWHKQFNLKAENSEKTPLPVEWAKKMLHDNYNLQIIEKDNNKWKLAKADSENVGNGLNNGNCGNGYL